MGLEMSMLEWCEIPSGEVDIHVLGEPTLIEDADGKHLEYPQAEVRRYVVDAYRMSKYPVTNAQYGIFGSDSDGFSNPEWWAYSAEAQAWHQNNPITKAPYTAGENHPCDMVCWYDAVAFCRWLSARLGYRVELPTEQQWQRAAQGDDRRIFPWGNDYDDERCNGGRNRFQLPAGTTDVQSFPAGASPFGVMDMVGNVQQWCLNDYESPDKIDVAVQAEMRVYRGGSFNLGIDAFKVTVRGGAVPDYEIGLVGFRVCCE